MPNPNEPMTAAGFDRPSCNTWRTITGLAIVAGLLAGCTEYLDRRDGITRASGDAPRLNARSHTIDPWPPAASNQYPPMSGERARKAIERYRTNKTYQPITPDTTKVGQSESN